MNCTVFKVSSNSNGSMIHSQGQLFWNEQLQLRWQLAAPAAHSHLPLSISTQHLISEGFAINIKSDSRSLFKHCCTDSSALVMANRHVWGEASQPGELQQLGQIAEVGHDGFPPPSQPLDRPASLWLPSKQLMALHSMLVIFSLYLWKWIIKRREHRDLWLLLAVSKRHPWQVWVR